MPVEIEEVFRRLAAAPFRRKFRLPGLELAYLEMYGLPRVMGDERSHVLTVIERWLAQYCGRM